MGWGFPCFFVFFVCACARVSSVSSPCALEAAEQRLKANAWYAQTLEGQ